MNPSQIDATVLSLVDRSWSKVAMVIARTEKALSNTLPESDETSMAIAKRIELLVRNGKLVAQGDISKWRGSEVRKPS